jgi:hypothetical protein
MPTMGGGDDRPVVACDLMAIEAAQREGHHALAEKLLGPGIQEIIDRRDGFALRFAADDYVAVTRFVDNERRCCPFFRFALDVAPRGGPIWLEITGPEGAKDALRAAVRWPDAPGLAGPCPST